LFLCKFTLYSASETNVTSHVSQQMSGLKTFLNSFTDPWKRCGGSHAARGPVFGPHWSRRLKIRLNIFSVR